MSSITINVGHIETVNLPPAPIDDWTETLLGQIRSGVSPEALADLGYSSVPDEAAVSRVTEEDQYAQAAIDATTRRNFLRNTVMHVDQARKLEGFQTNHERHPDRPKTVNAKQHTESVQASESLKGACGACALRSTCKIKYDIDRWVDVHPYKSGPKGARRPGSRLSPRQTESRESLLRALENDPMAHCEPTKRAAATAEE